NTVLVARQISTHFNPGEVSKTFHYYPKRENGTISKEYKSYVNERASQTSIGFAGTSTNASIIIAIANSNGTDEARNDSVIALSKEIVDVSEAFGETSPIAQRYFGSFTQTNAKDKDT